MVVNRDILASTSVLAFKKRMSKDHGFSRTEDVIIGNTILVDIDIIIVELLKNEEVKDRTKCKINLLEC